MCQVRGHALWDPDGSHPDHDSASSLRDRQVLWPLTDQDKLQVNMQTFDCTCLTSIRLDVVTDGWFDSAASVSVPAAPPSGHELRTRASEGEQTAQETPEEDGKVKKPQAFLPYRCLLLVSWFNLSQSSCLGLSNNLLSNVPHLTEGSKQRKNSFEWRKRGGWREPNSLQRLDRSWRSESC